MADEIEINIREIAAALAAGIEDADALRAAGLTHLSALRRAHADELRRERDLRRAVNEQDPRLPMLERRLAREVTIDLGLSREAARAATPPPPPDAAAWVLHGRVLAGEKGLPRGLRARLIDRDDEPAKGVKPARVDERGVFVLRYPPPDRGAVDQIKDLAGRQVGPVFLQLVDARGAEVARDPRPLTPRAGQVEYREIEIGEEEPKAQPSAGTAAPGTAAGSGQSPPSRQRAARRRPSREKVAQ
jgi:hypothetical protein